MFKVAFEPFPKLPFAIRTLEIRILMAEMQIVLYFQRCHVNSTISTLYTNQKERFYDYDVALSPQPSCVFEASSRSRIERIDRCGVTRSLWRNTDTIYRYNFQDHGQPLSYYTSIDRNVLEAKSTPNFPEAVS
jgi:hypothetical protein